MKNIFLILLITILVGCGSSNSSDGMLIEGSLEQAGDVVHHEKSFRHTSGEKIEEVSICALGQCSITDSNGQWGFVVSKEFKGGHAEFIIKGHGIDTVSSIHIPENANNVFIELKHAEDGSIEAHKITADGVEQEEHDHD